MTLKSRSIFLLANSEAEKKAAELTAREWEKRFHFKPQISGCGQDGAYISFSIKDESKSEEYSITHNNGCICITAHRLRGLVYGIGRLLRNLELHNSKPVILGSAFGSFCPHMPVRGHGIGYTDMSNTYEAWDSEQLSDYIIENMYFGMNTVETSYSVTDKRTKLMKYDFRQAFVIMSRLCMEWDVDLTVWYAVTKSKTDEQTIADMMDIFGDMPLITSFFIPGGDPGDMLPEEFMRRCIKIKQAFSLLHPNIQLIPSAQAPHEYPDWKERFARVMSEMPEQVDAIIYGPNHAMSLDELRRTVDSRYPLHHYPDISHNVRCETPVHFLRDDWHFAWASTLSRESVNPRPVEYTTLHRRTRQYVQGQISYSEGVHDDVNKAVWSGLDFDFYAPTVQLLQEYARLHFFPANANKIADSILGLEQSWSAAPEESPAPQHSYNSITALARAYPFLNESWRFNLLLFRAACDKLVRDRRIFELSLLQKAEEYISAGNRAAAITVLERDFTPSYKRLRASLFNLAEALFNQIGIQLDTAHFGGMSWERGCTLETIDMPVTDRLYILKKLQSDTPLNDVARLLNRCKAAKDEYYFSFALHGFEVCGAQDGEFYINFMGDRNGDAALPMCMLKNYDHFSFKTNVAGLTGGDYLLRITYKSRNHTSIKHHRVCINGSEIFNGSGFGGARDTEYEKLFLAPGYESIVYHIPREMIINGCVTLEITEPVTGFVISEFSFTKHITHNNNQFVDKKGNDVLSLCQYPSIIG